MAPRPRLPPEPEGDPGHMPTDYGAKAAEAKPTKPAPGPGTYVPEESEPCSSRCPAAPRTKFSTAARPPPGPPGGRKCLPGPGRYSSAGTRTGHSALGSGPRW